MWRMWRRWTVAIGTQELPLTVEVSFANGGLLTADEIAHLPVEMRMLPSTGQEQPIGLHIDEAAVRNAVADALERVAKQVRGE